MEVVKVTVKVPATSANLGPGFDCLGMALDFYNTVSVEVGHDFHISISGEGADVIPRGRDNRIYASVALFYEKLRRTLPDMAITCYNEIPLGRGLGSSASAIVAGLMAANVLCGKPLSLRELATLGASLEGHADNVVPALLGGCQIVVQDEGELIPFSIPFPEGLRAVLFIPDFQMPTDESRALLPRQVSRADAVFNIGRVALLVASLSTGRLDHLAIATQDRLHQPARQALFPAMSKIFQAALSAGAKGVFLSGGGPTILALTEEQGTSIGEAMKAAAEKEGLRGRVRIARPSDQGAHLIAENNLTALDSA